MIVNLHKFQVILLDKYGSDNTNTEVKIGNKKIKSICQLSFWDGIHIEHLQTLQICWKSAKCFNIND